MKKSVDGVLVEMSQSEIAEFNAARAGLAHVDPPPTPPVVVAMAELGTTGGEVTGIDQASGIGFAMMLSPGVFWLFFSTPQPDVRYLAFVQSPGYNVDVTAREMDYLEVTAFDRMSGEPSIPTQLAVTIQRTK